MLHKKKLLNYPEWKGWLFLEYIGLLLIKVIKYYKQAEFYSSLLEVGGDRKQSTKTLTLKTQDQSKIFISFVILGQKTF